MVVFLMVVLVVFVFIIVLVVFFNIIDIIRYEVSKKRFSLSLDFFYTFFYQKSPFNVQICRGHRNCCPKKNLLSDLIKL